MLVVTDDCWFFRVTTKFKVYYGYTGFSMKHPLGLLKPEFVHLPSCLKKCCATKFMFTLRHSHNYTVEII